MKTIRANLAPHCLAQALGLLFVGLLAAQSVLAQSAASGVITGGVFNSNTGEYGRSAEVRIEETEQTTTIDPADRFSPARAIGPGAQPRLAIDAVRRRLHLVYVDGDRLLHRTGNLAGEFGEPEAAMTGASYWDPSIAIDDAGEPHVAVANGHYLNRFTWYSNRKGGAWKPPLVVVDNTLDGTNRATTPHLHVHDGSAYVGVFTVGGGKLGNQWGMVARIENLSGSPRIAAKRSVDPWNPQVFVADGTLWIGGRNRVNAPRRFTFQPHDQATRWSGANRCGFTMASTARWPARPSTSMAICMRRARSTMSHLKTPAGTIRSRACGRENRPYPIAPRI